MANTIPIPDRKPGQPEGTTTAFRFDPVGREIWTLWPLRVGSSTGPKFLSGTGSPEGVVTAPVGSTYLRTDGGASTTMYVKESGTGNVGWVAYGVGGGGGGGGAPTTASYVVMALDAGLTAERRLQVGAGLSMVDGGANGDVTLDAVPVFSRAYFLMGA